MLNKILHRLFWYLAKKLDYRVTLQVNKHFYYKEIKGSMPDNITIIFG